MVENKGTKQCHLEQWTTLDSTTYTRGAFIAWKGVSTRKHSNVCYSPPVTFSDLGWSAPFRRRRLAFA
ncbi:hypothetical protein M408DRAFT_146416 [Serendipita vermifera MAFF 305830]|uniref:Uncharacterized protein n=1 Tax=Serendipita vermifera MAFF 305830 TaxID=933852 RepID=A0A0C3ATQ8_SERVB|nr:hypothetical protein M408DRAFT_146416 [Serendipita vermifera MAFF 305830]